MMASNPAYFNSGAKWPPTLDEPIPPVKAFFPEMESLPDPGARVPVKGPVAKMSKLSGSKGCVFKGRFSKR
jgi:hypothetical protein